MGNIGFYIFYALNYVITLLPLSILYIFSDFLFLILYYFPSYRRKIVADNLKNSFPELSQTDRQNIERRFYKHLADLFVETLKLTHLSNTELKKRFTMSNPELLARLYDSDRDLVVVHSHYNNWEWLVCLPFYTKYKIVSIYKPLQNELFDKFLHKLRTRNNLVLTNMTHVIRDIVENRRENIRSVYGFLADQSPAKPEIRYRTTFLHQDTPVYLGIEKIAKRYDMPVVFFNVQKVKRGHYNLTVELLFDNVREQPDYFITDTHVKRLESLIRQKPEYWVWTHRRWKY
jgi:KDO2-lipid IV(A) lauroyltransferase